MPTITQIRAAFRTGIVANPAQADVLRALRRSLRDEQDTTDDLREALRYVGQTPAAAMDREKFFAAIALIGPALASLPATGAGSVRAFRNDLRRLLADATSPQWLKDACEAQKRTRLVDTDAQGRRAYDQQATDPINALADAALLTLAAPTATPEELAAAVATIDRWRDLTPENPTP